jgi:hypothetical protein
MKAELRTIRLLSAVLLTIACTPWAGMARAQESPSHQRDRGPGTPTSMFGTYVQGGQLLVYPFFEYYLDKNLEYKPSDLVPGGPEQDFRGRFFASEGILFVSYGITDRVSVEMEGAVINARQEKDPKDLSAVPQVIKEQGTGDVEGQIHVRLHDESDRVPELYSYFEAVSPQQRDKLLIGTPNWEFSLGAGMIRGNPWGTVSARLAATYSVEDGLLDLGEYAVEYLRSVSPRWRVYAGFEGEQDELSLITEAQWHFSRQAFLKVNNGFGITSKATDWAPEVGIMFALPGAR